MKRQAEDRRKGHRARLRGRLVESGVFSLQDYEVIELALTFASRQADTKAPAKALLEEFGSVSAVLDADPSRLKMIAGVGEGAAQAFCMIRGVAEYYRRDRARSRDYFARPSEVVRYVQQALRGLGEERFTALYLGVKNEFLDDAVVSSGTTVRTTVYPARVFKRGMELNAAAVVLAHNHPGGRAQPSEQDLALTSRLMLVGDYLDMPVVDHLIVAGGEYYSMAERGDIARLKNRLRERMI